MSEIKWDESSTLVDVSSSQHILNLPSWADVDLENQTVNPTLLSETIPEGNVLDEGGADFSGIPEAGGGIVGGWYGTKKGWKIGSAMPHPLAKPIMGLVGGMVGAFTGGATAEGAQQGFYALTDSDQAPDNWQQGVNKAFLAGGEEMLYEALGQSVVNVLGMGWRILRGKPKHPGEMIQDSSKQGIEGYREGVDPTVLGEGESYVTVSEMLRQLIEESGGKLSASQVTSNFFIQTIEGLSRAAWGGGALRDARHLTDEAIVKYVDDYIKHFNQTAGGALDAEGMGILFKNMIKIGKEQHSAMAGDMYKVLDDLYTKKHLKTRKVKNEAFAKTPGQGFTHIETSIIDEVIQPVNVKSLKKRVQEILKLGEEVGNIPQGEWGGSLLNKILTMKDEIGFDGARELRSFFLAESRSLATQFGEAKSKMMMRDMEQLLMKAMDKGALGTGNKAFIDQYKKVNEFWAEGSATIRSKNIAALVKLNPEHIGAEIFKEGNITLIKEARKAILRSGQYAKGTDDAFDAQKVWLDMQSGYLNSLIAGSQQASETVLKEIGSKIPIVGTGKDVVAGQYKLSNLKALFIKNTPLNNTFKTAFTKNQQKSIREFTNVLEAAQGRTTAAGDFMVKVGQAGLILDTFGLIIPGSEAGTAGEMAGKTTLFTVSPWLLAKTFTSPRTTKLLARSMMTKLGTRQASAVITQLLGAWKDIYDENTIFVVVHGLKSIQGASGFAQFLQSDEKDKRGRPVKPKITRDYFAISSPNYTIIQRHKNLNAYLKLQ